MPFPSQVNVQPAPAVAGDFASANPRASYPAGPGALVAGSNNVTSGGVTVPGVIVGNFGWVDAATQSIVNNTGTGAPTGFVHREQQALIVSYLAEASLVIPQGFAMTLMIAGDFWVKNSGTNEALPGMTCYANYANGAASFAAAGALSSATFTAGIAASTAAVVGSITGSVMTVTSVTSGTLVPGATISGTGIVTGTQIVSQASGTTGGVGTYNVSTPELSVPTGTAIAATYGTMTVSAVATGAIGVGDLITTGAAAGTVVTALGTGTGGTGTYIVSPTQTVSGGTAMTAGTDVATVWQAVTGGLAGELIKISSWT